MHAEGNGLGLILYVSSTGWEKTGLYDPPGTRRDFFFLLLVGYRKSESRALGSLEVRCGMSEGPGLGAGEGRVSVEHSAGSSSCCYYCCCSRCSCCSSSSCGVSPHQLIIAPVHHPAAITAAAVVAVVVVLPLVASAHTS
jgi:hypothetical protein